MEFNQNRKNLNK